MHSLWLTWKRLWWVLGGRKFLISRPREDGAYAPQAINI